jgi:hypothetical protein
MAEIACLGVDRPVAGPGRDRLMRVAAVIAFAAGYLASRRATADCQNAASALQQADSMPRESAGTF